MSTTNTSAHVCTTPARDSDAMAYWAVPVPADPIPLSGRRYWPTDNADTPPPGAINPASIMLVAMSGVTDTYSPDDNDMYLISAHVGAILSISRHPSKHSKKWAPATLALWTGFEIRRDATGAEWSRSVHLVVNDHGWLVEVPQC